MIVLDRFIVLYFTFYSLHKGNLANPYSRSLVSSPLIIFSIKAVITI